MLVCMRFKDELEEGVPPEFACSESGWITIHIRTKQLINLEEKQRKKMAPPKTVENVVSSSKLVFKGKSSASKSYKIRRPLPQNSPNESESYNEDCLCTVCLSPFSQSGPGEGWSHLKCTNGLNTAFHECRNCESDSD
ncbi:hypothetical protein JTB14_019315 [Gonioctena quinquepunctata]|nr:hypothetical protein JTB14_019315 [Gonioctena quinquepunctata]